MYYGMINDTCKQETIRCFSVPLGSVPELPAETCKEIKTSEGGQAVSARYWISSIIPEKIVFAYCDMKTEGTSIHHENWCLGFFPVSSLDVDNHYSPLNHFGFKSETWFS